MPKSCAVFSVVKNAAPKRDAVLLNGAAALFVAGKTKSLAEGWNLAGPDD